VNGIDADTLDRSGARVSGLGVPQVRETATFDVADVPTQVLIKLSLSMDPIVSARGLAASAGAPHRVAPSTRYACAASSSDAITSRRRSAAGTDTHSDPGRTALRHLILINGDDCEVSVAPERVIQDAWRSNATMCCGLIV
jgi:hypothetical protein